MVGGRCEGRDEYLFFILSFLLSLQGVVPNYPAYDVAEAIYFSECTSPLRPCLILVTDAFFVSMSSMLQ
jgi:hypothetical protein